MQVTRSLAIPADELEWRFTGSGGPGGQHANTSNTRVELRFDIAASPSLGLHQRARLLDRFGPIVRVVASDERSQTRNRELALARMAERLAGALKVQRARRPTRPSKSAVERRIGEKRRQGDRKRARAIDRRANDD
ncbi:MAG: aminoacyl-tRNA hydrolase [Actinomycetota bacterium]|nr:aminoacyl-tRNA hydrolase [Actinomycetota bacterium]